MTCLCMNGIYYMSPVRRDETNNRHKFIRFSGMNKIYPHKDFSVLFLGVKYYTVYL